MHDLAGNVWEWTRTMWLEGGSEEDVAMTTTDVTMVTEAPRVLRGGAWDDPAWFLRCSFCGRSPPRSGGNFLGFRVVLRPGFVG